MRIPLIEKVAYGLGNFMPTAVTATGGMAMYFYTDIAGLSAAFIGAMLLFVRIGDAAWDIYVGRLVDRSRTRWGQCRPFLLVAAPMVALALVASFTVPPWEGAGRTIFLVAAYVTLWWCYSLVQIPFQSMMAMVAPDPEERLRLAGVNSVVQFIFVIALGAGFPIMKDVLAGDQPAVGFQRAALLFAVVGLILTWTCFALVRERVAPTPVQRSDLRADARVMWASRAWRVGLIAFCLQATLIGLMIGAGVYFFTAVLRQPAMIGPYMGLSGLGLVAGVLASDRITRRFCKKQVLVVSAVLSGLAMFGFALVGEQGLTLALTLAFVANALIGAGAPISVSMIADTADSIELASGRRVVGTLFATVNFSQKVGAGLASALIGASLAISHYAAGAAVQSPQALMGVTALMSVIPAALCLAFAGLVAWGYPLGRSQLVRMHEELAQRRAAVTAVA
jgi:glycoside/pentoside/hexuronide:cation symporter, GPH family